MHNTRCARGSTNAARFLAPAAVHAVQMTACRLRLASNGSPDCAFDVCNIFAVVSVDSHHRHYQRRASRFHGELPGHLPSFIGNCHAYQPTHTLQNLATLRYCGKSSSFFRCGGLQCSFNGLAPIPLLRFTMTWWHSIWPHSSTRMDTRRRSRAYWNTCKLSLWRTFWTVSLYFGLWTM